MIDDIIKEILQLRRDLCFHEKNKTLKKKLVEELHEVFYYRGSYMWVKLSHLPSPILMYV
jgi:hypothetical protein